MNRAQTSHLIQEFIEWLRKEGWNPSRPIAGADDDFDCVFIKQGFPVLRIKYTDEEQPEVLVWCLKELERRGYYYELSPAEGSYEIRVESHSGEYHYKCADPTLTEAAINALVSTSGVREE